MHTPNEHCTHSHARTHARTHKRLYESSTRPPPACPLAHPRNPIGAGDIKGNHGDVTTADFDETTAHIITTPLQWACDNVPCECEFEQKITLGGPADTGVRVDATLHNHRSDTTDYGARSQELPAVYSNGPYYRLLTTEGGELKEYNAGWDSSNSFPWVPGAFTADEHWAALVDESGWGMGVVNLDTTDFIGGFSGEKGSGGPYDAPTGYVAPVMNLALPANTTYEYTFFLVLGDVATIRAYAQQVVEAARQEENSAKDQEAAASGTWEGCEGFPGFGSALDSVTLTVDGDSSSGGALFNITTRDFLSSRTCDGDPDLIWSHQGTFQCGDAQAAHAAFNRSALWIEPRSIGGAAFAKVLCPHVAFSPGVRANIDVDDLPALCSGLTFNNCEVYYDALQATNGSSTLTRSATPSCDSSADPPADGPALGCVADACFEPCPAT